MGGSFIVISFVVDEPMMTSPKADAFSSHVNDGDLGDITKGESDNICTDHTIKTDESNHLQYELPVTANCKLPTKLLFGHKNQLFCLTEPAEPLKLIMHPSWKKPVPDCGICECLEMPLKCYLKIPLNAFVKIITLTTHTVSKQLVQSFFTLRSLCSKLQTTKNCIKTEKTRTPQPKQEV